MTAINRLAIWQLTGSEHNSYVYITFYDDILYGNDDDDDDDGGSKDDVALYDSPFIPANEQAFCEL